MITQVQSQGVTSPEAHRDIDEMERMIASKLPPVEMPVEHNFVPAGDHCPGFYCRTIFMPTGTVLTSKIHKTEHPYMIHTGQVVVWIEGVGARRLKAPYSGVTQSGTRRVLVVEEDCTWTTFHPTAETDLVKIENDIIEPRESSLAITGGAQ